MIDVLYILFLSWVVVYADFNLTKHNLGAKCNGVGAAPLVLRGIAKSPMQYRVLIPWLCGFIARRLGVDSNGISFVNTYLYVKWVGVIAAIGGSFWYFSRVCDPYLATALLAGFLVWAALYDYADVYWEVAFLSVAFASFSTEYALLVASIVAFVGALNRETAVLIPTALLLSGAVQDGIIVMVCFACGLYLPVQIYGKRERYCPWFMWRKNIRAISGSFGGGKPLFLNEYSMFFGLVAIAVGLYANVYLTVGLSPIETTMGIFFVGILIPSMWREIRVFAPVTLALIPMALRGLVN